jgi:hypothetical protein
MNAPTAAATAQRATGPIVWLDMDQQALDDAYDQLVYAPNRDQLTQRRIINCAATRKRIGDPLRFAYGQTPIEGFDVFPAGGAKGGGRLRSSSMAAPGAPAARPITALSPNHSCAPAAISSCSISSRSMTLAAVCFRWWSRCGARSAWSIATPTNSAATTTGFI